MRRNFLPRVSPRYVVRTSNLELADDVWGGGDNSRYSPAHVTVVGKCGQDRGPITLVRL
jgi:hypothetical protein